MTNNNKSESWDLINEFAGIRVKLDNAANGPRLKIEDLKSGEIVFFDPLQLEGMVWAKWEDLKIFVDPSIDIRWK